MPLSSATPFEERNSTRLTRWTGQRTPTKTMRFGGVACIAPVRRSASRHASIDSSCPRLPNPGSPLPGTIDSRGPPVRRSWPPCRRMPEVLLRGPENRSARLRARRNASIGPVPPGAGAGASRSRKGTPDEHGSSPILPRFLSWWNSTRPSSRRPTRRSPRDTSVRPSPVPRRSAPTDGANGRPRAQAKWTRLSPPSGLVCPIVDQRRSQRAHIHSSDSPTWSASPHPADVMGAESGA